MDKLNIVKEEQNDNIETVTKPSKNRLDDNKIDNDSNRNAQPQKDFTSEKWAMLRIVGGRKTIPPIFKCY
mgnify:CR=1 FL=1